MKYSINLKWYGWLLILTSSLLLLLFISSIVVSTYLEKRINDSIQSLQATASYIDVNLFSRSIEIGDLQWASAPDSINSNQHIVNLNTLSASGINLLQLLLYKKLVINELVIGNGKIHYDKSILRKSQRELRSDYRSLLIKRLSISTVSILVNNKAIPKFSGQFNCTLTDIDLNIDSSDHLKYSAGTAEVVAKNMVINRSEGMYGGTIAQFYLNTKQQRIQIDSASLVPNFGKFEFAHQLGKQTDRVTLSIPKLTIEGMNFKEMMDTSFVTSKMEVHSFNVVAFRDKRVPTLYEPEVPLPMESFIKFPYKIKIDTITIIQSMVTVEEIPEKGGKSGMITFENINASLTGLNNRIEEKDQDHALLSATGLLMGAGKINVLFRFPLDSKSVYNAKGSISQMPFTKLNPALDPLANIRMESGLLNELNFNFNYTKFTSKGILEIDYQGLRLIGLGNDHRSTNEIKTLLLNALIKNDRNQSSSKRAGVIDLQRDRKRFVFNIWWKSIRDGLKSIVLGTKRKD
jgi:hypothetical protein